MKYFIRYYNKIKELGTVNIIYITYVDINKRVIFYNEFSRHIIVSIMYKFMQY